MRKKIAMRWRREALRRGAILSDERMVFSKKELRENGFRRKHNGFGFKAEYKGWKWMVCSDDILDAYRLFVLEMDDNDLGEYLAVDVLEDKCTITNKS